MLITKEQQSNGLVDLSATPTELIVIDVKNDDVLAVDVGNEGTAAFTSLTIHERVSPNGPLRDITPSSFTTESGLVFTAAATAPGTLAAGGFSRFSLNVSDSAQIAIRATGNAGAKARVTAAAYKVSA